MKKTKKVDDFKKVSCPICGRFGCLNKVCEQEIKRHFRIALKIIGE